MHPVKYLRLKSLGEYLHAKYGFGARSTLAKLACISSDGPAFHKAGRAALYKPAALDEWALAKIGRPQRSTSDTEAV
ncbi:MAG: hypothetical protein WDN46_17835 [Methylocella sp.]